MTAGRYLTDDARVAYADCDVCGRRRRADQESNTPPTWSWLLYSHPLDDTLSAQAIDLCPRCARRLIRVMFVPRAADDIRCSVQWCELVAPPGDYPWNDVVPATWSHWEIHEGRDAPGRHEVVCPEHTDKLAERFAAWILAG